MRWAAALMLLWLILRTLKYSVVTDLTAGRYIWYLYYLPMLLLPLLWVYIALSMGKSEDYRPLYFICLGWMVVCMAFSLVCLFRKSRIPSGEGKRITPFGRTMCASWRSCAPG